MSKADPRLDRVPFYDERSKEYPVREMIRRRRLDSLRSYSWRHQQFDQGREGACTGFAVATEAAARPVVVEGVTNAVAQKIYHRARQIDIWPGEDYEGSSVLAAIKASIELYGWYAEYRWALGPGAEQAERDLAFAVGHFGPAILGTWWRSGMYEAAPDGYLKYEGDYVGGHAYAVTRFNIKKGYWTPNSWGGEGQGWISRSDMVKMLDEQGEAAIMVKRRKGNG